MIKPGENPLAELVIEAAGMSAKDPYQARRKVDVLRAAWPHLSKEQQARAKQAICRLETRWGSLLAKNGDEEILPKNFEPVQLIARWFSTRSNPEALSKVLKRAAEAIGAGTDRLMDIEEYAYKDQSDRVLRPPTYSTFERWLIQLNIGRKERRGHCVHWVPGPWHMIWVAGETVDTALARVK